MIKPLPSKWMDALSLKRRGAPEFYSAGDDILPGPHADAIHFNLSHLNLSAVFCIEGVPTIGFLNDPGVTLEQIDELHRILWNQGLMSLLLVIGNDEVRAYSLVKKPFIREEGGEKHDPRLIETLSLVSQGLALRQLIDSAESGRYWFEHDEYFDPTQRVDSVLLDNLLFAYRRLKGDLGKDEAQSLLMQTMFIAYLEDRRIITPEVFKQTSNDVHSSFEDILAARSNSAFNSLFDWLRGAFNGDVFNSPLALDHASDNLDNAPITHTSLNNDHFDVLRAFRHGKEEMATRQLRFFGYNFRHMPIALISAVYDRFLKEESERRNAEGAFYTPLFLADVAVSQIWDELSSSQKLDGLFCDPACGSGIFLVRIFKRLVNHHCGENGKSHASWDTLIKIVNQLHGADVNPSAVRVAAFSMYIALMEHVNPPDLPALIEKGKMLPPLFGITMVVQDFFTAPSKACYDAVVGNPPWKGRSGLITTAQQWCKDRKYPDPGKDIAWGFIWKALSIVKGDGFVGLLLPAMGILHNTSGEKARKMLIEKSKIRRIMNLSDLCFQLFDGANRPTAFFLYQSQTSGSMPYFFEYWVPKSDLNLRLKRMMTLARPDRIKLRSDKVLKDPSIFKRRLWTRSPDERLLQYLQTIPALNFIVQEYKSLRGRPVNRNVDWVIGQGFKPINENRLDDPTYDTAEAPITTKFPFLNINMFQSVVLPEISSHRRTDEIVHRAGFVEGFAGPHILIPQGVERAIGRVRAAYTEQDLVFQDTIQSVVFPNSQKEVAKLLTTILNSKLAAWFYFHDTANFGADRAKVHQNELLKLPFALPVDMPDAERAQKAAEALVALVDYEIEHSDDILQLEREILDEIDSIVYDYYGLDEHDIALIEDTFEYFIPAMQPRRNAGMQKLWKACGPAERSLYANTLCEALAPWFRTPVSAMLAAKSADIAVLRLSIGKVEKEELYSENKTKSLDDFLDEISSRLPVPLPGNVQVIPDLRFVIGSDMYLVKPTQLRYWLRSTALADAEQIAAELNSISARNVKQGHQ